MIARSLAGGVLGAALLLLGASLALAQAPMDDPNVIRMQGKSFVSPELVVPAGTTVTWVNLDAEDHTVVAWVDSFYSPVISNGQTWSLTFDTPGRYAYLCDLHANMEAVLVVADPSAVASKTVEGDRSDGYDGY